MKTRRELRRLGRQARWLMRIYRPKIKKTSCLREEQRCDDDDEEKPKKRNRNLRLGR
jgi:hypothetical protein